MSTRSVAVQRTIKQIRDGLEYEGIIGVEGTELEWHLELSTPIDRLDDEPIEGSDDVRRVFQFTIKRGGARVELTDEEYAFFFSMLAEFTMGFYHNPQTRSSQEGLMGEAMRHEGAAAAFGITASIGLTSDNTYQFPPEVCAMLSQPKFGCPLTA